MHIGFLKNKGVLFIIKFLILFAFFYYFNLFFISITANSSNAFFIFIKQRLDYIDWLRYSILHTSIYLARLFGVDSYLKSDFVVRLVSNKGGLKMVYKCVGYGVMSFWAAFVFANSMQFIKKCLWLVIGWLVIWFLNCIRVSLILMAIQKGWPVNKYIDHHDLFTIVAYSFIFLLIYIYTKFDKLLPAHSVNSL